jgi:hypothetical protein
MVSETARHAGHADIIRERIDGRIGADASIAEDPAFWQEQVSAAQAAADWFRSVR